MIRKISEKYRAFLDWIKPEKNKLKSFAKKITKTYFITISIIFLILLPFLDLPKSYNELGDFLAGIFSPVAFFWLVIGYLMQHEELQLNRKSLNQQMKEFSKSVKISDENLKLQKKIYEENKYAERQSNLPILYVTDVKPDPKNCLNEILIKIKNIGKKITNISFAEKSTIIIEGFNFSVLKKFEELEFKTEVDIINYNKMIYRHADNGDPRVLVKNLYMYFNDSRNVRFKTEIDIFYIIGEENSFYAEFSSFGRDLIVTEVDSGY